MSDYLFMLENHLDAAQNKAVARMQAAATAAGTTVWLTGGAMRDMLRGAPIRDLDFTVEHDAEVLGKQMVRSQGPHEAEGEILAVDSYRHTVELRLADGVKASISNARTEKYLKPGGKPQISPATIHEDLQRRDFTINAIALSLNRGSRGLLIDPTNGQADLQNRELRTTSSWSFFNEPVRMVRMIRFQHGLGFQVVPRTLSQFENGLLEEYQKVIPARDLAAEIHRMAVQPNAVPGLDGLAQAGILQLLSPSLAGEKRNSAALAKLEKLAQSILPPDHLNYSLAFLTLLTENLSAREKAEVIRAFDLSKRQMDALRHLDEGQRKLEASLKSPKVTRPSHVYEILQKATVDQVVLALCRTTHRSVQDRIRSYYEKYLPLASEVTDEDVIASGAKPGTPKFARERKALVTQRLNARPRKAEPEAVPASHMAPAPMVRGARAR